MLVGNDQVSEDGTSQHVEVQRLGVAVVVGVVVVVSLAVGSVECGVGLVVAWWTLAEGLLVALEVWGREGVAAVALSLVPPHHAQELGASSICRLSNPALQCSKAVHVTNHSPVYTNLANERSDQ